MSSIPWVTPRMMGQARPKPGAWRSVRSPTWLQGLKHLGHHVCLPGHQQGAGLAWSSLHLNWRPCGELVSQAVPPPHAG